MSDKKNRLILDEFSFIEEPNLSAGEFWLYNKTILPFTAYDDIFKTELDSLASQFSVPHSLNEVEQLDAGKLLESFTGSFKGVFGDNVPVSYKVGCDGAVVFIDSYAVYDYEDYCAALSELSGYVSAEHILDELVMSFAPLPDSEGNYDRSKMLPQLKQKGVAKVIRENMPSERDFSEVNTTIEAEKVPLQLRQAISKANVIYSFIENCLRGTRTEIDLVLTIDKLTMLTVIKRNGVDYEIEGINDIHLVLLGLSSISELDAICEEDLVVMYREIGVIYTPSEYDE
jgi:hypothetical protein